MEKDLRQPEEAKEGYIVRRDGGRAHIGRGHAT
jgi:hypothetical protein